MEVIMKRNTLLIAMLIATLLLAACSPSTANDNPSSAAVSETATIETTPTTEPTSAIAITSCPSCRVEIAADSVFCSACGIKIADYQPTTETQPDDAVTSDTAAPYDPTEIVKDVENYVQVADIYALDLAVPAGLSLRDDFRAQDFTLNTKQRYRGDSPDVIRLPYLIEDSQLAADINKQILALTAEPTDSHWDFDYDAYIYDDVLSIAIRSHYQVVKTFNFDISSGQLRQLSAAQLFDKIGASQATVELFLESYIRQNLEHYYETMSDKSFVERGQLIEDGIGDLLDQFTAQYESDTLSIYKAQRNASYSVSLKYDAVENYSIDFTLADDEFEMALLSAPAGALGFYYRANQALTMPARDANNNETALHVLNKSDGDLPLYFVPFVNQDNYIELADIDYAEFSIGLNESIFVKKLTAKDINLPQTDKTDIYLYHTYLPEGMPSEAICMNSGFPSSVAQETIYEDVAYGDRFEYIFGRGIVLEYFVYSNEPSIQLDIQSNRLFEANGQWQELGIPITRGSYSNDDNYFYFFPCAEDIANGADDFYIFKILQYNELQLVYGSNSGAINIDAVLSPLPIDLMIEPYY